MAQDTVEHTRTADPSQPLVVSRAPPMPRKPLRSQMNQIRAWVRQGRTDAWIAHQLEVPASELREFRRRHSLDADGEEGEEDLRDEIEAEIEAATLAEAEAEPDEEEDEDEDPNDGSDDNLSDEDGDKSADDSAGSDESSERAPRRRRRRRGGGRGRGGGGAKGPELQATFDHGEQDGIGLWLDPAVRDDAVYTEHWAGHRAVEVSIEADRITIRRSKTDD